MTNAYNITLQLNKQELPDESALIENMILNGTLSNFLYTVVNDIVEGRYSLEEGHTRIILNQLIETVSSIYDTVGSMDTNVQDITASLNKHTDLLKALDGIKKRVDSPSIFEYSDIALTQKDKDDEPAINKEVVELPPTVSVATESLDIDSEGSAGEGLALLEDMDDVFDIEM